MPKDISKEIGTRIKSRRKELKMTQTDLAEKSQCHESYIGQLERGIKTPTIEILFRIAAALDISLSEFLSGLEDVSPKGNDDTTNYAIKSYKLIAKLPASAQENMYNVINNIIIFTKDK